MLSNASTSFAGVAPSCHHPFGVAGVAEVAGALWSRDARAFAVFRERLHVPKARREGFNLCR